MTGIKGLVGGQLAGTGVAAAMPGSKNVPAEGDPVLAGETPLFGEILSEVSRSEGRGAEHMPPTGVSTSAPPVIHATMPFHAGRTHAAVASEPGPSMRALPEPIADVVPSRTGEGTRTQDHDGEAEAEASPASPASPAGALPPVGLATDPTSVLAPLEQIIRIESDLRARVSTEPDLALASPDYVRGTSSAQPGLALMVRHREIGDLPASSRSSSSGEADTTNGPHLVTIAASDSRGSAVPIMSLGAIEGSRSEAGGPIPIPAAGKLEVLDAQTHFPPVVGLSPIDQIAGWVVAELGQAPVDARKAKPDPAVPKGIVADAIRAGSQAALSCIKSLTVQLEPDDLGVVTIRMRLSGTTLGLDLEAEDVETTRLIGRGRQQLAEKLRASGFSIDTFVIRDRPWPGASP